MFSVALAVWYKLRYKRKAMMLKISMVVEKTESRRPTNSRKGDDESCLLFFILLSVAPDSESVFLRRIRKRPVCSNHKPAGSQSPNHRISRRESVRPARRIRSPKSAQRAREVNRFFSIFCKVSEKNGIGQRPTVCAMVRERAEPNLKDALSDRTVICASETQSVPEGTSFGLASCTLPFSDCFSL